MLEFGGATRLRFGYTLNIAVHANLARTVASLLIYLIAVNSKIMIFKTTGAFLFLTTLLSFVSLNLLIPPVLLLYERHLADRAASCCGAARVRFCCGRKAAQREKSHLAYLKAG